VEKDSVPQNRIKRRKLVLTRQFDKHLDNDELDVLVSLTMPGVTSSGQLPEEMGEAQRHAESCQDCHRKVQMHKSVQAEFSGRAVSASVQGGPGCLKESEWMRVAAGLLPQPETKELMKHAAQCGHCGPLLQRAANTLSDDATPDEEQLLVELVSSRPAWQRSMAEGLRREATTPSHHKDQSLSWKAFLLRPLFAWAGGFAIVVSVAVWFAFVAFSPDVNHLLAQAYSEKRTIEMRLEGAPYTLLSQDRGAANAQNRMSRPALLRAETEIAQHLKVHPDDPSWLHARGRASLLEVDPDTAVTSLEQAQQFDPDDESIAIDLATAYSLRAQSLSNPGDDARAVDILGRVLAKHPNNEVARFNYAIALERLSLYQQAMEQWSTFLQTYPSSDWANEARARRSDLKQKIDQHQKRSEDRVNSADEIAAALRGPRDEVFEQLNKDPEGYLNVAVREWLPKAFENSSAIPSNSGSEWTALSTLAEILAVRHDDIWLREVLRSDRHSSGIRDAFVLLADVARLTKVSDSDQAAREAVRAATLFKESGVPAGEVYATFQLAYVNQLSHHNLECSIIARSLLASPHVGSYPWLRIQTEVESAICASTSDENALEMLKQAFDLATTHHYEVVRSRANQVLSAIYWAMGDTQNAWRTSAEGLRQYWTSSLPPLLGYNLLTNLDYLAEDQEEWFLQTLILKEALPLSADNPDPAIRAFEQVRLGQALLMTDDVTGAEAGFRRARVLFESLPNGSRKDNLIVESEIGLAKIDLQRGFAARAATRLSAIRDRIVSIPDDDLNLDFLQTYGLILLRNDHQKEAQENLEASLKLAEKGLQLVHNERDRLRWSRRNEPAYRAMVALTLKTDPKKALKVWEWYKGASLRERPEESAFLGFDDSFHAIVSFNHEVLSDESALVTFLALDDGIAVWVSDANGVQERWVSANTKDLESISRRFAEHCSEPTSNIETLRHESRELYRFIILPIESLIRGHRTLIFEPDRDLKLIPFIALLDQSDSYLGDHYSIAVSPGLEYLARSTGWRGLSRNSRVLVVGNPLVAGLNSLSDAESEARAVAADFNHPVVLLGADANYEHIIRELPRSELFHFAGHAVANSATAALLLSHSEVLDVSKLDRMKFQNNQLIVLAACSSAEGSTGVFDDEDSVARRLIGIGAPEVVASRWTVDSAATTILMNGFYQKLVAGETVAEALNNAARQTRSRTGFEHPFYWAGFSVFGRG
jgi:CHAT domain-containing protein/cytochrome c-type biogenesis protein CcmH/NrfG